MKLQTASLNTDGDDNYYDDTKGANIFNKSRSHLKILGSRKMTWSKHHTENPQIFWATAKKKRYSRHREHVPGICSLLMIKMIDIHPQF